MTETINLLSLRDNPAYLERAISYFQDKWATEDSMAVYDDCLRNCINADNLLPQWYLLTDEDGIIIIRGVNKQECTNCNFNLP